MIELSEAKAFVLESIRVLEARDVALKDAGGCVVAQDVAAVEAVPGFDNSSMDGFALRSSDTVSGSVRLAVVGRVHAGDVSTIRLESGQAMRIMTGAPLPAGADCVCMVEEAEVVGDSVVIPRHIGVGDFVRRSGDDIAVGQLLCSPGEVLNPASLAVLAGQGLSTLRVHPRPRVGVLSTGNELVSGAQELAAGQIRDLNRPLLLALLAESGFAPVDLGTAEDGREAIAASLARGVDGCDAVVTTGGVSVGEVDFVKLVIAELGGDDARWMQVAIKPGKPFAFAVVGPRRVPLFGLPGNPVSTRVSFELFVRPALKKLAGHRVIERFSIDAVLDGDLDKPADAKVHLVHVNVAWGDDGRVHVVDTKRRGSHLLNAVARANAIAVVPEGSSHRRGDVVRVIVLDPDSLGGP